MRGLFGLLIVGSLFAIGTVLFGGLGDLYEIGDIAVLPGSRVLVAGFVVLGGALAALFSWGEVDVATEGGITTRQVYRPGMIGLAVILFAAAGFLVFRQTSEVAVFELAVGDCFDDPASEEVLSVATVPCSEPHDDEVFANVRLSESGGGFPGQAAVDEKAGFECFLRFAGFVGTQYEDSILDITFLSPTPESWAEGDRAVTCAVYRLDGRQMTGSARGSGQ